MTDDPDQQDTGSDEEAEQPPPEPPVYNLGEARDKAAARGFEGADEAVKKKVAESVQSSIDAIRANTRMLAAAAATIETGMAGVIHWHKTVVIPTLDIVRKFEFSGIDQRLRPMIDQVAEVLNRIPKIEDIERRILTEDGPDNWAELHGTHDLRQLLTIAEYGIPVTWVPRAEILAALIQAEAEQRENVLISRQADILDDCDAVLAGLQEGASVEQVRLLRQATHVLRLQQFGPAQALAASIIDTVLRAAVLAPTKDGSYYPKVKKEINNATWNLLPWAVTHWPVLAALENFNGQSDEPTPARFNRHATAHQADLTQLTMGNALIAVMLATSMLREARHVEDEVATMENSDIDS